VAWLHCTKAASTALFIPITGTEAEIANHRKFRRSTGKYWTPILCPEGQRAKKHNT